MSNHSGSYLLNKVLNEVANIELLDSLSEQQRERLIKKLWGLCWEYDCNWGEIIDIPLSEKLGVCRYCGELATELDENGYCNKDQMM